MDYKLHSHRHAEAVMRSEQASARKLDEVLQVIRGISDSDLRTSFETKAKRKTAAGKKVDKSLAAVINELLRNRLSPKGWKTESPIFKGAEYGDLLKKGGVAGKNPKNPWRLDFANGSYSIEVAFNHGEAIPWNLLKPVIAGELNHVKKAIQSEFGIVVCATSDLKSKGNFDSAVGEYEKFLKYLKPLRNFLTIPILIVGLEAPKSFRIDPKSRRVVPISN